MGDIVVTAQKRSEAINDVPMTITAVSGDALAAHGITDTSQLTSLVPGLTFTKTGYATTVYTLRGVGFQDNTLSNPPSVAVYVDEVPLPFSTETQGAALDLQRVEVLKGPQGTLYGENSTGGAINYISAKPTKHFEAGLDASYGSFNTLHLQGFVSGPISDTLRARLAVSRLESGPWQRSFSRSDSLGVTNLLIGRLLVDWTPTDRLTVEINVNGSRDRSDSQAAHEFGILPAVPANGLAPEIAAFPAAPQNDRAADWDPGVSLRGNNVTYQGSARIDFAITPDVKLTSISAYTHYNRNQPVDTDGTPFQLFAGVETGYAGTFFQELRLSGEVQGRLNWIVGANYQSDRTYDQLFLHYNQGSPRIAVGLPVTNGKNTDSQNIETKAVYGNVEYKLQDNLTLQGGVRYTDTSRDFAGCTRDSGDGQQAATYAIIGPLDRKGAPGYINPLPGECVTVNAQTLQSGLYHASLDERNLAWRAGLSWKPTHDTMLYANVSKGYKAGSFPTLSAGLSTSFTPVRQESILAYEAGFKLTLLHRSLQLVGAAFYYDYTNKQIKGKTIDPVFGPIAALVNVPKSTIKGLEFSAIWRPVAGLTISPGVTMAESRIDGTFTNYDLLGHLGNFGGEALPYAPKWTGNVDAQFEWPIKGGDLTAFVGSNMSFQSSTNGGFGNQPVFNIKAYQLLDLRAGVETPDGKWRFSVWGRNVTNTYYWTSANHLTDTFTRFTGMPATYGISLNFRYR